MSATFGISFSSILVNLDALSGAIEVSSGLLVTYNFPNAANFRIASANPSSVQFDRFRVAREASPLNCANAPSANSAVTGSSKVTLYLETETLAYTVPATANANTKPISFFTNRFLSCRVRADARRQPPMELSLSRASPILVTRAPRNDQS